jgi:hypothetical protein
MYHSFIGAYASTIYAPCLYLSTLANRSQRTEFELPHRAATSKIGLSNTALSPLLSSDVLQTECLGVDSRQVATQGVLSSFEKNGFSGDCKDACGSVAKVCHPSTR